MTSRFEMPALSEFSIGETPIRPLPTDALNGAVWLKLETENPTGSVKDRTAYFLIRDLWERGLLSRGDCLVESTSGNLGISMAYLGLKLGLCVCCIVDRAIAPQKLRRLEDAGAEVRMVEDHGDVDLRALRINLARSLGEQAGRHWLNQYGNSAGMRAHEATTGIELLDCWIEVDEIVAPVGTGGTICGIGRALRVAGRRCRLVGVEPAGSTIFGGKAAAHCGYGAGYIGQTPLFARYGKVVDLGVRVPEAAAKREIQSLKRRYGLSLGMTTGLCLAYARKAIARAGHRRILCIAPDSGDDYLQAS